ncbi:hypothetical protein JHK86_009650 [Glycine max]|nr:hypothetical protein JHK86_009650 [Glycine max]
MTFAICHDLRCDLQYLPQACHGHSLYCFKLPWALCSYYIEANNEGSWNWIWSSENGLPDNIHSLDEIRITALVHVLDLYLGEFKSPFVQRYASAKEESIECNHVA